MTKDIVVGLLVALGVAMFLSPVSSPLPDGLEKAGMEGGFIEKAVAVMNAPFSEYTVPGIENKDFAFALAGLCGTLAVFGAAHGLGIMFRRKKDK